MKTNCQRSSDGAITETKNLAPAEQEPAASLRLKRRGRSWLCAGSGAWIAKPKRR